MIYFILKKILINYPFSSQNGRNLIYKLLRDFLSKKVYFLETFLSNFIDLACKSFFDNILKNKC